MYDKYWELASRPFENQFSSAFYFASDTHESARIKLRYMIESGLGAGLLCGPIGSGKTAVTALLRQDLAEAFGPMVHVVFPQMPPAEFLAYLAAKLSADDGSGAGRRGIDQNLRRIEGQLHEFGEQGLRPTIVIDEAHLIEDVRVLECLQLLLNFQDDASCSFSLILAGSTTFLGQLERIPQLNDRLAIRSVLEPLSREETVRYVLHRLSAAGVKRQIFDDGALDAICDVSAGIPRRINRLCDLALLVGFAGQLTSIGAEEIRDVAQELPRATAA